MTRRHRLSETQEGTTPHAVTEHALIARINRQLSKNGNFLRKTRPHSPLLESMGKYYLIDSCKRYIEGTDDLTEFGKKFGALDPDEFISNS